jgi:hypothetical protein
MGDAPAAVVGPAMRVGEKRALSFLDLVDLTGLQLSGRGSSARQSPICCSP